ncbi:DUF2334 domain-containing protein [Halomarina rubra]|uniref:DUF2334 domain-containing protein n=1 Tax=Halomarina rubra TaxID=2071873 RepID=A0ABD6AVK8_9EURY|nr:DUF2334 domain-containing protein [Halomarina rubra]
MSAEQSPSGEERAETQPDWGSWSTGRAVVWSSVGVALIIVLASVATGALASPFGFVETEAGPSSGGPLAGDSDALSSPTAIAGEPSQSTTWTEYDAIVVFRNDDIQPYYRPETMRAVDQVFIEEGVPVTLGVIPQVGETSTILESDLCAYLRANQRAHPELFEVSLHGYTHERRTAFHGGSEFGGLDPDQQRAYIESGTRTLTECVGERPTAFVPPMDTYDKATVDALRDADYSIVSGGSLFTNDYYNETGLFERDGILHAPNNGGFVANWTTGAFYNQETLEQRYDWAVEDDGLYIQMLHYQFFDTDERLSELQAFIQYVKASGEVRFMTLGELGERMADGSVRQTDDGWEVKEPVTSQ